MKQEEDDNDDDSDDDETPVAELKKRKVKKMLTASLKNSNCEICGEELKKEEDSPSSFCILTKCYHGSCKDCMSQWILEAESLTNTETTKLPGCPICRVEMTKADIENILGRPYSIPQRPEPHDYYRTQQKIRNKQQRLLLLRHANKCQYEPGTCPVTPLCENMKILWGHIAHCKDRACPVQHCLSSRYVLSHYRRCKDNRCASCGPVRQKIRKSIEKEKKDKEKKDKKEKEKKEKEEMEEKKRPPSDSIESDKKRRKTNRDDEPSRA